MKLHLEIAVDYGRVTGKPEVTFNADSDDVVPKSGSRTSLVISSNAVPGYFDVTDHPFGTLLLAESKRDHVLL